MPPVDAQQVRQLIDRHGAALVLYARQWCQAPDDALQDALIELPRQALAPENPLAWLYKTVRRRAMNLARAERRRVKHQRQARSQCDAWFLPTEDPDSRDVDVESLLRRLPRLDREIVVARIWGERSLQEIAELVELSSSSVHRRYHGALARLKRMITRQADTAKKDHESRPIIS